MIILCSLWARVCETAPAVVCLVTCMLRFSQETCLIKNDSTSSHCELRQQSGIKSKCSVVFLLIKSSVFVCVWLNARCLLACITWVCESSFWDSMSQSQAEMKCKCMNSLCWIAGSTLRGEAFCFCWSVTLTLVPLPLPRPSPRPTLCWLLLSTKAQDNCFWVGKISTLGVMFSKLFFHSSRLIPSK